MKSEVPTTTFPIGIKGRFKHGILLDALNRRGWNQSQAARFLGIDASAFGAWINMKKVPSEKELSGKLLVRLYELTGKSPSELWPEEIFTTEFLERPKTFGATREMPVNVLRGFGLIRALPPPTPDDMFEHTELAEALKTALAGLTPRQRRVIEAKNFEGKTLDEIGAELGVCKAQAGNIEIKALKSLRKRFPRNEKMQTIAREILW